MKEGNIVRLFMRNFLTYTEIEVYPGANLNIVFGPNGSGKSSILCAICIVLGGKPEYTGRGKDVKDYIKHGEEKATVEIELFHARRNIVIKRMIARNGRTTFYYQGRETSQKDVMEKVDKFGICINNLCQFLPQDRVSEFSKLNKIELLHNTQRAIGESVLADQHQTLCERGKTVDEISKQIGNLQKQLTVEKAKNNQLRDQVEAIKTEKSLDKLIKQLKGIHMLRTYITNRKELKDNVEPLTKKLLTAINTLQKTIQPLDKQEQDIQRKLGTEIASIKQMNSSIREYENKGKQMEEQFNQLQADVETEESDFKAFQTSYQQRRKEIDDLKRTIQAMEGHLELQDEVNEQELQNDVKMLTRGISALSQKSGDLKKQLNEYTYQLVAEANKRGHAERSLRFFQDTKERRLKILLQAKDPNEKARYNAVYEAATWIPENIEKFEGPIHGPLYTIINVSAQNDAKYVENTVSRNDLIAFICESKNDVNLLKRFADNFNWPINILHSQPAPMSNFLPTVPIERLREIGFETYLKDVISAPPAVISYLCNIYRIQNIALGSKADFTLVPNTLSCFFIGEERYDKTVSRYDGAPSTSISPINDTFFLSFNSSEKDLQKAQRERETILNRIQELQSLKDDATKSDINVEKELEALRGQKQQLQNKLQQKLQLVTKIAERRKLLARREEHVIDVTGANLKMKTKIKTIITELLGVADRHSHAREELSTFTIKCFHGELLIGSIKEELQAISSAMETTKSEIAEAQIAHSAQKSKETNFRNELRRLVHDLCAHLDCTVAEMKNPECGIMADLQSDHQDKSNEEIQQLLVETEARRECMISPSINVIEEYNKRESSINQIESDVQKKSAERENCQANMEEAKSSWLPKIEELTDQISRHFSSFMKRLGCAGVVTLDKGANETDYSQYGLSIMVQFRDTENLKELTAHQQSGGERSVSTALFLMALQTLTAVPFRCVDEINQGMDATNEERMFSMLVETSTAPSASQYFFLTPKLLKKLPSSNRVKYLNIINGSHVPSYKHMRAEAMLDNLRKSIRK